MWNIHVHILSTGIQFHSKLCSVYVASKIVPLTVRFWHIIFLYILRKCKISTWSKKPSHGEINIHIHVSLKSWNMLLKVLTSHFQTLDNYILGMDFIVSSNMCWYIWKMLEDTHNHNPRPQQFHMKRWCETQEIIQITSLIPSIIYHHYNMTPSTTL